MNKRSRYYRGIGSGIVRILAENPTIELDNDVEGKEFKVIIWRTILKDMNTTQKRVLEYFMNNPKGTRVEAANALGDITEDGVKFVIGKLQQKGLLKRIGGRKQGEWQVITE